MAITVAILMYVWGREVWDCTAVNGLVSVTSWLVGMVSVGHFACLTWIVRDLAISFAKSCLRRGKVLYAERLWIERSSCCRHCRHFTAEFRWRKLQELFPSHFFYRHVNSGWWKRSSLCIVVELKFAVEVNRYQNISVFLTQKTPYSIEGLWKAIDPARKVARMYPVSWDF